VADSASSARIVASDDAVAEGMTDGAEVVGAGAC
jgi:hypothetical protein